MKLNVNQVNLLLYLRENKVLPKKTFLFSHNTVKSLIIHQFITNNLYANGYFLELTDKAIEYLKIFDKKEPTNYYYCSLPIVNNNKDLSVIKIGDSLEVSLFEIDNSVDLFLKRLQNHLEKLGLKEIVLKFIPTKDFNFYRHVFIFK